MRYTANGRCVACALEAVERHSAKTAVQIRIKAYRKQWYVDNKEMSNRTSQRYHADHRTEQSIQRIERRRGDEGDSVRALESERTARRMKTDLNFRLGRAIRTRILSAIRRCSGRKARKTIELLGCTVVRARAWLSRQFRDEMAWTNWGTVWQIDHKQAVGLFDLTTFAGQKRAFHYTNLQPLLLAEHRAKTARDVALMRAA